MKIFPATAILSAAIVAILPAAAMTKEWDRYGNARFEYWIDIPPGFSAIVESDNGDGGIAKSDSGNAELRVWGNYILDGDFADEVRRRIEHDVAEGWTITYQRIGQSWSSWSGTNGNRIFYQRAIPACDDAAANFRIEYDSGAEEAFDPIVHRLATSMGRSTVCRTDKALDVPK